MTSVCGPFNINDYVIRNTGTKDIINIDFKSPTSSLIPGKYTIIAKQSSSQRICVLPEYDNARIIPHSRRNSKSLCQSPAPVQSPARSSSAQSEFKSRLLIRDKGACVITRDESYPEACHIVALAYWNLANRSTLPESVRDVITSLRYDINSVRNGLLLCPNLHVAFDHGKIGIKYECNFGSYTVVAIDTAYEVFDGIQLWQLQHSSHRPPHPDLLDYHLACCVMTHMKGCAEYIEDFDDPDSDFYIPDP